MLASTSAAVVASFFGVAGTIVGAALVSIVATVGTAAYSLGIRRTRSRLQQVQALRLGRAGSAGAGTGPSPAADDPSLTSPSAPPPTGDGWRGWPTTASASRGPWPSSSCCPWAR